MDTAVLYSEAVKKPLDEKNFHLLKVHLRNTKGETYADFKKKLVPLFTKVWKDIASGWGVLLLVMAAAFFLLPFFSSLWLKITVTLLCSVIAGYAIAYLNNFFHEAAHYNIAAAKNKNDRLANIFIGILFGQGIGYYRIIHWEHHKNLGTPQDTETSYFESPDLKFVLYSLTGIRVGRLLLQRNDFITGSKRYNIQIKKEATRQLLLGILFHAALLITMGLCRQWWLMAIWITAVGCWYPFFNSLRQLLEHRSDTASKKSDYTTTGHGKLTRLFGDHFFDRTFGSAGFNKHLLHHLEPQLSYTRINELEIFLKDTSIAGHLQEQKSAYLKTFFKLLTR